MINAHPGQQQDILSKINKGKHALHLGELENSPCKENHRRCSIQRKKSVTIIGSSILFINVYFPVTCLAKYEEYIMCLGILSSILESHEEDHVCILGDFNATPGSLRFNEMCDMLHENNVMFRDTDILSDNTYTDVNNASQTGSWLDHIAMTDVLSESTVN